MSTGRSCSGLNAKFNELQSPEKNVLVDQHVVHTETLPHMFDSDTPGSSVRPTPQPSPTHFGTSHLTAAQKKEIRMEQNRDNQRAFRKRKRDSQVKSLEEENEKLRKENADLEKQLELFLERSKMCKCASDQQETNRKLNELFVKMDTMMHAFETAQEGNLERMESQKALLETILKEIRDGRETRAEIIRQVEELTGIVAEIDEARRQGVADLPSLEDFPEWQQVAEILDSWDNTTERNNS